MRILLVGDYPPDPRLGSTRVLLKLQESFVELGHACDVLLADDLGSAPRNRFGRQALAPLLAAAAVRRAVRARGPYDVVDVASAESLWLPALRRAGLIGRPAIVARSNGLEHLNYRRMVADHGAGLLSKPPWRRLYYPAVRLTQVAAAIRGADGVVLLNDVDKAFAVARGWKAPADLDVVPHGVSARWLADAPAADRPRDRRILFCGTWDHAKGIHYLAAGFSSLVAGGAPALLTVLGGAVPEATIRSAFPPAVEPLVTVVPRVAEDEVVAAYRAHDVLAFPSTYEGFGMVVPEAMSQRLPVVATPVGCAARLVEHERTGLVVPPRDAGALARALGRMVGDHGLARRCAEAAFERVRTMTWTSTASATLDVYERALARRTARG